MEVLGGFSTPQKVTAGVFALGIAFAGVVYLDKYDVIETGIYDLVQGNIPENGGTTFYRYDYDAACAIDDEGTPIYVAKDGSALDAIDIRFQENTDSETSTSTIGQCFYKLVNPTTGEETHHIARAVRGRDAALFNG